MGVPSPSTPENVSLPPRFKVPVDVVFVDAFPRNQMGKIVRTELRDRLAVRPAVAAVLPDTVGR